MKQELRRIRNIKLAPLLLCICWLPYGAILGYLFGESNAMLMAVLLYAGVWLVLGVRESSLICPRCRQKFHSRPCRKFPAFTYVNCFSWTCLHCGLRVPLRDK